VRSREASRQRRTPARTKGCSYRIDGHGENETPKAPGSKQGAAVRAALKPRSRLGLRVAPLPWHKRTFGVRHPRLWQHVLRRPEHKKSWKKQQWIDVIRMTRGMISGQFLRSRQ
jgi:hypothetical protein